MDNMKISCESTEQLINFTQTETLVCTQLNWSNYCYRQKLWNAVWSEQGKFVIEVSTP